MQGLLSSVKDGLSTVGKGISQVQKVLPVFRMHVWETCARMLHTER